MSLPARAGAPPKRAIDEAIRAIPIEWFKASPSIYWADFLGSTVLGWGAFAAGVLSAGWLRLTWLAVAAFALYRAVLFIHETTHRVQRDVPTFTFMWNALAGVPLGRALRLLVTALTPDAPYTRTIEYGFTPVLRDLLHRTSSRSRR